MNRLYALIDEIPLKGKIALILLPLLLYTIFIASGQLLTRYHEIERQSEAIGEILRHYQAVDHIISLLSAERKKISSGTEGGLDDGMIDLTLARLQNGLKGLPLSSNPGWKQHHHSPQLSEKIRSLSKQRAIESRNRETPGHPGQVEVLIRPSADDREVVVILRDNGCGIAPEMIDKITSRSFSTKPGSNGMGSHNSANLLRKLGGTLRYDSAGHNQGSEITITLPLNPGGSV